MNLSVKNVPEDLVRRLKERAKANHRSLQGEVLSIIEESVGLGPQRQTITEIGAEARRLSLPQASDAAALVRADRDSH